MKSKMYSDATLILLEQIEKYSGFSSSPGLYYGKTGATILLYHGSRFFHSLEMERVAGVLIDDIVEEIEEIHYLGFTEGLCGIAWGVTHLMKNGFIDFDETWFDNVDEILFCNGEYANSTDKAEFTFLGLYILSRYEIASDKNVWIVRGNDYCNKVLKLLENHQNFFINIKFLLTPFLYFLLKWQGCKPSLKNDKVMSKIADILNKMTFSDEKTINRIFTEQIYYKLFQQKVSIQFPEKLSLVDVNAVYFNQLIFQNYFCFPEKILNENMSLIVNNNLLLKELLLLFNHKTIGLSQYVSGFAWSLLQYNQNKLCK